MTIPDGWLIKPLAEVAQVVMGQSPDSKYYSEEEVGLPFLQGCAEFQGRHPKHGIYCSHSKKIGCAGSILLSVRAPVGRLNVANRDYVIGRGLSALKGTRVTQDFLEHFLVFQEPRFRLASQGSTFEAINSSELKQWPILHPKDKAEQAKIAEVLSTVDRAIEETEALIAKQQRIKTGLMQDLLTRGIDEHGNLRSEQTHEFKDSPLGRIPVEWDARLLSEVVDLRVGYAFKRAWFADEGVRLLRGENVGTGSADWKDTQWLPSEMADKYPEYMLAEGDIVIGMDRTFTKQGCKVTILGEADVPCLLVQRVGCFMPVQISSDYMQMVIQSPQYQRELLLQQKGMDIPHLSKGEILSPLIPIPKAVEEMESIAGCAKALRTALTNESTHLNTLRLIKTGLMQDLLTGDRRVTALLRSPKEMVGA